MVRIKTTFNDKEFKIIVTPKAEEKLTSHGVTEDDIISVIASHIDEVLSSDDNNFMVVGGQVAYTGVIQGNEIIIDRVIDSKFVF